MKHALIYAQLNKYQDDLIRALKMTDIETFIENKELKVANDNLQLT